MSYSQEQKDSVQVAICALWETLDKAGKVMPLAKQRGYLMAFGGAGLSVDEIERACAMAMARCKWFPMPADLIAFVRGTAQQQAEAAWLELQRALDAYGSHHEIMIADPALALTIKSMGGLGVIANRPTKDQNWARKEFGQAYESHLGCGGRSMIFPGGRRIAKVNGVALQAPKRKVIGHGGAIAQISQPIAEVETLAGQLKIGTNETND